MMDSEGLSTSDNGLENSSSDNEFSATDKSRHSRRDIVRHGVKLAFVVPVISTFFASDAYAANYSCYPTGQACDPPGNESCCSGSCNVATDLCD